MRRAWIALALSLALIGSLSACGRDDEENHSGTARAARRAEQFVRDGSYSAGKDGQLRGGEGPAEDLEEDLKALMRKAEKAARDTEQRAEDAARDLDGGHKRSAADAAKE